MRPSSIPAIAQVEEIEHRLTLCRNRIADDWRGVVDEGRTRTRWVPLGAVLLAAWTTFALARGGPSGVPIHRARTSRSPGWLLLASGVFRFVTSPPAQALWRALRGRATRRGAQKERENRSQ